MIEIYKGEGKGDEMRKYKLNKIYTIVNPAAAGGKTGKRWPDYKNIFFEEGFELDIVKTNYPGEATKIARKALTKGYKNIMAVGGDGTVNEVINGFFRGEKLINPQVRLIIFSRGSGSDYIKSLGLSGRIEDVIRIIKDGSRDYLDLGLIDYISHTGKKESRYFINVADAGIGGETVYNLREKPKKLGGFTSYLFAAVKTILHYKNKDIRVTVDNRQITNRKLNTVLVANGKYFAGGMKIAPEANIRDGKFDIVILGDLKKGETLFNLYKAYRGKHLAHPKVNILSGKEVILESEERVLLEIDGESVGKLPAKFTLLEKKLPVLIF